MPRRLRVGKLPRKVLAVLLSVALSAAFPASAGPPGNFVTDFNVQNLGTSPANIAIIFYYQNGNQAGTKTFNNVPAGSSAYFNPATMPLDGGSSLPSGFQGSAVVQSDQPLAAITTLANDLTGLQYVTDAYVGVTQPNTTVFAPIVMANLGPWNTRISIQNAGSAPAPAYITYKQGGTTVTTQQTNPIPPGASIVVDQATSGLNGFNGSAIITSTQPLAISVDEYKSTGGLLVSYTAIPLSKASTTVYMPGYINAYGPWTTDFTIINTGSAQASVSVSFTGISTVLDCSIPANGTLYLNPAAGNYGGCSGGPLPPNYYGGATVTATQPVVVAYNIANTLGGSGNRAIGYTGIPPADTGTVMAVPLIENGYGAGQWVTTFSVQVLDGSSASLTLEYSGSVGGQPYSVTKSNQEVKGSRTFNQASDGHVPPGFLGSVKITSNKPIAVIADQNSLILSGDVAAGFPAVKIQ
jgi:hypothetical protein